MFAVEKIINDVVFLENIKTGEIVKVSSNTLKDVKESDIIIFKDNKYIYSKEETLKRKKQIKNLKNKLKVINRG